ncbi:hypothetical protein ABIB73_000048 [Bradyrhizobium sp. F1.4.3]
MRLQVALLLRRTRFDLFQALTRLLPSGDHRAGRLTSREKIRNTA